LLLCGRTIINCFFENSTRTRTSSELAGKRLGGGVINMSVPASSMVKGETLIDTAMTLNAMHPDVLVVRHPESEIRDTIARADRGAARQRRRDVTGSPSMRPGDPHKLI
jgi:aspartate carbamoyltransferase catalytic subunit